MLKVENVIIGGREFTRAYSDAGFYIKQDGTGAIYAEAYDIEGAGRTYTETTEKIEKPEERKEDDE